MCRLTVQLSGSGLKDTGCSVEERHRRELMLIYPSNVMHVAECQGDESGVGGKSKPSNFP